MTTPEELVSQHWEKRAASPSPEALKKLQRVMGKGYRHPYGAKSIADAEADVQKEKKASAEIMKVASVYADAQVPFIREQIKLAYAERGVDIPDHYLEAMVEMEKDAIIGNLVRGAGAGMMRLGKQLGKSSISGTGALKGVAEKVNPYLPKAGKLMRRAGAAVGRAPTRVSQALGTPKAQRAINAVSKKNLAQGLANLPAIPGTDQ